MTSRIEQDGLIVMAMIKGQEKYLLLYEPAQANEAIRTLGRWASDPQLSFTWYDAAVATQEIQQRQAQQESR